MSVTFGCPDAPVVETPCEWCAGSTDPDGGCSSWCSGTVRGSTAPEVNFSNFNAAALLDLLGLNPVDLVALIEVADLPDFLCRIVRAMNTDRSHLVREAHVLQAGHAGAVVVEDDTGVTRIERRGCRVHHGGNTDEQTLRRLRALEGLVKWAQERGRAIEWG